jgi:soluble lytic murein transglycosylase-like protein
LRVLQWVFAILMISIGTAVAMPLPEPSIGQASEREASADPASDIMVSPVQSAARDLTGVKDETRLPMEPLDAPSERAAAKPASIVNPQPVPELSRSEFCSTLAASAEQHNVPVPLFANLIWQESRFRPQAISPVGALGVAQFMPRVAEEVGLKNPFNPLEALPAAARFFRSLVERFGSLGLATAAYNAGSGRVGNWLAKRTKVLPKETQNYVRVITGHPVDHWRSAKAKGAGFAMAASMPCRREAVFARFDQADLPETRQVAEQRLLVKVMRIALRKHHQPAATAKARHMVIAAKAAMAAKAKHIVIAAKARIASKSRVATDHRGRKVAPVPVRSRVANHRHEGRFKVAAGR